jgi:hypothetical protein
VKKGNARQATPTIIDHRAGPLNWPDIIPVPIAMAMIGFVFFGAVGSTQTAGASTWAAAKPAPPYAGTGAFTGGVPSR